MSSRIYNMVESEFKDKYSSDDAHWLFSEFKELMECPSFESNVSLCINIAIEKWKDK